MWPYLTRHSWEKHNCSSHQLAKQSLRIDVLYHSDVHNNYLILTVYTLTFYWKSNVLTGWCKHPASHIFSPPPLFLNLFIFFYLLLLSLLGSYFPFANRWSRNAPLRDVESCCPPTISEIRDMHLISANICKMLLHLSQHFKTYFWTSYNMRPSNKKLIYKIVNLYTSVLSLDFFPHSYASWIVTDSK